MLAPSGAVHQGSAKVVMLEGLPHKGDVVDWPDDDHDD